MSDILRKRVMHATNRDGDNGRFSQPSTPVSRDQIDELLAQCRSDLGASPQSRTSMASTATFHTARNIEISTESGGRKLMSEEEVSSLVHNALRRARQATSSSSLSPRHRMRRAGGVANPLSPGSTGSRPPPSPTKSSFFFPENQGNNNNEASSPSSYLRGRSGRVALPAKYSRLDSSLESKGSFVAPSIVGSQEFASTIEATVSNISGFSDAPQYSSNTYGLSRAPTEDDSLPHDASMNSSEAIIRRVEEEIANARRAAQEANRRLAGVSSNLRAPVSYGARSFAATRTAKEPTPSQSYVGIQHPPSTEIPHSTSGESDDNPDNKYSSAMEMLAAEFDDDVPSFDQGASESEVIEILSPPSIQRKQPVLSVETGSTFSIKETEQSKLVDIESRHGVVEKKKVEEKPIFHAKYRHIISPREEASSKWTQLEPLQDDDKNLEPMHLADCIRKAPEFPILESETVDKARYIVPASNDKAADESVAYKETEAAETKDTPEVPAKPNTRRSGLPLQYSAEGNAFMRMLNKEDSRSSDTLESAAEKLEKTPSKEIIDLTTMGSLVSSPTNDDVAIDQSLSLPESIANTADTKTNAVDDHLDQRTPESSNEMELPSFDIGVSKNNTDLVGSFEIAESSTRGEPTSTSIVTDIKLSHSEITVEEPGQIVPKAFDVAVPDIDALTEFQATQDNEEDISLPISLHDVPTISLDESTAHDMVENVSMPASVNENPTLSLDESTTDDMVENVSMPASVNEDPTMSLEEPTDDMVENASMPTSVDADSTMSLDESNNGKVDNVLMPISVEKDPVMSVYESNPDTVEVVPSNDTAIDSTVQDPIQDTVGEDMTTDAEVDQIEQFSENLGGDFCISQESTMDDDDDDRSEGAKEQDSSVPDEQSECDALQPQSSTVSEGRENYADIQPAPFAIALDDGGEEFGFEITAAWSSEKCDSLDDMVSGNLTNHVHEAEADADVPLEASSDIENIESHIQSDEMPLVTNQSVEESSEAVLASHHIGTSQNDEKHSEEAEEESTSPANEENDSTGELEAASPSVASLSDGPSYAASTENDTDALSGLCTVPESHHHDNILESTNTDFSEADTVEDAKDYATSIVLDNTHSTGADTEVARNGVPVITESSSSEATEVAGNNELPGQSDAICDEQNVFGDTQSPSKSTARFWWTEENESEDHDETRDGIVPPESDGESGGNQDSNPKTSLVIPVPNPQQQLELVEHRKEAKSTVSEKEQHLSPDTTPSPVQENIPSKSNQAAPKSDAVPISASLRSSKVRFKQRYPVPPMPRHPRASEDIINDNRVARDGCALFLKKPKPDLQELLDAARGSSIPRRSNACGALKVLTLQKKNKLTLVRTAGFLDALVFATSAKLSRRDMEASLDARARAVCAISSVAEPKDNRELVMEHPGLMTALVKTAIEDKGEARTAACGAFAMLAKTPANREPLAHTNNLLNVLAMILTGKLEPDLLEEPNPTYSADDEDSENSASTCSGSESSASGVESDFSHSNDEDEVTLPTVMSMREQKREQTDETVQRGQLNACAALLHISKQCGATPLMCYNENLLEGLIDVLQIEGDPMHTKYLEILCNFSRFPENNAHLAQAPGLIDTLVENGKSPSAADRLWALRTIQNISSDATGKGILATRVVLEMLSMGVMRDSVEEKLAATSTLANLSTEPGAVVPLTNTKNVVATLVHVAHNPDSPSEVRTLACDALATIGLWLQTLAGAGTFPPELAEPIALPSYVTSGWQRWD